MLTEFSLIAIRCHGKGKVFLGDFSSYPDALLYRNQIAPRLEKYYCGYEIDKPGHGVTEQPSDMEMRLLQKVPIPADSSSEVTKIPQSVRIASKGIHTIQDAASLISAGIADMMSDEISTKKFGAAISGVRTLLQLAQANEEYREKHKGEILRLTPPEE